MRSRFALSLSLSCVTIIFGSAIPASAQCRRFLDAYAATSESSPITEYVGSSGSSTSIGNFYATYNQGSLQPGGTFQATFVSSNVDNANVATVAAPYIEFTGTGATYVHFTVSVPTWHYINTCNCCVQGGNLDEPAIAVTASSNFWDPNKAPDIFRSPASSDSSYSIGAYSGSGSGHFGTPSLDLANNDNGGIYRADFPLQWTNEANGTTSFSDTHGQLVSVFNPSADENGWWATPGPDKHLVIVDTQTRQYFEFYLLNANSGTQSPNTSVGMIVAKTLDADANLYGNDTRGYTGTEGGTTASRISGFAGAILPHELDCANCITHALSVIIPSDMDSCNGNSTEPGCGSGVPFQNPFTSGTEQCNEGPQSSSDGGPANFGNTNGLSPEIFCEGARIFLPYNFTPAPGTPTPVLAIINALKQYGGIIVDQGGKRGSDALRFYTAGYYDTNDPPVPMLPSTLQYQGLDLTTLAPYMAQIGQNLQIEYTCISGCQ